MLLSIVSELAGEKILIPECLAAHEHAIVCERDVTADGHVDESLGADKLDRVEQIHQDLVDAWCSLAELFLNARAEVKLAEWSHFETPREFQISVDLGQVSDSNQAQHTDFKDFISSVFSDE